MREGKVLLVYRHFPFLGPESEWAAEASECAREQGRFWEFHDRLFEVQGPENAGAFRPEALKRIARGLGLNGPAFDACLDAHRYREAVRAERERGERLGVRGTPTLLLHGPGGVAAFPGVPSWEDLRRAVETLLGEQEDVA